MATNPEEINPKYCMYCGAPNSAGAIKCVECGKDVSAGTKALHEWKNRKEESKAKHTRICKNCNTIIESPLLLQCPICSTPLPEILPPEEVAGKYIFHGGKRQLVATQDLKLDPNSWKLREMGGVFMFSLVMFLFIEFAVVMLLEFGSPSSMLEPVEPTMMMILLGAAVSIFLGIYPIIYVYMRNMNPANKLGLRLTPSALLGILFGFGLIFALIAGDYVNEWLASVNPLFAVSDNAVKQADIIQNGSISEQLLYGILLVASNIMEEVLFRGVLLKGLDDALPNRTKAFRAIIFTSLIYTGIFAFLNFSLAFLITDFLMNLVLCVAFYLSKKSSAATMIAKAVYSIFVTLIIIGVITLPF